MMDMFSLASIASAFFVVAVSPGPANLANATLAMNRGRGASLVYGAGLSTGLAFWGVIAAGGLGVVLQQSLYLMTGLKILGGLYLIWLAFVSGRAAREGLRADWPAAARDSTSYRVLFVKGIVLNVSNPKTVIAWMAALSVGLDAHADTLALVSGAGVCVVVGFAVNALYSIVFSFAGMMQGYRRAKRWIDGLAAGLFAVAGVGLFRSAWSR